MAVINFEIYKVLGTLSEGRDGKKKQLTCTSWGRYNPKFDLRAWDDDYTGMTKGVTLSLEEATALRDLLNAVDLESIMEAAIEERASSKATEESPKEEVEENKEGKKKTAKRATKSKGKKATVKETE